MPKEYSVFATSLIFYLRKYTLKWVCLLNNYNIIRYYYYKYFYKSKNIIDIMSIKKHDINVFTIGPLFSKRMDLNIKYIGVEKNVNHSFLSAV